MGASVVAEGSSWVLTWSPRFDGSMLKDPLVVSASAPYRRRARGYGLVSDMTALGVVAVDPTTLATVWNCRCRLVSGAPVAVLPNAVRMLRGVLGGGCCFVCTL
jgi:hypothetical protein